MEHQFEHCHESYIKKTNVSLENNFWLPKSARSAQTAENSCCSFFNYPYTWYKSLIITVRVTNNFALKMGTGLRATYICLYPTMHGEAIKKHPKASNMTSGWRLMYVIGGAKRTQDKVIRLQKLERTIDIKAWVIAMQITVKGICDGCQFVLSCFQ